MVGGGSWPCPTRLFLSLEKWTQDSLKKRWWQEDKVEAWPGEAV